MVRQKNLGRAFEPILHAVLRRADAVITTSPNYLKSSKILARHLERCCVIPLGIRIEDFGRPDPVGVAEIQKQFGESIVLCVGRLVYYKGLEYLIRAMAQVQGQLLIVGKGPLRAFLIELAERLGVRDRVHFLGKLDHRALVQCYHAAKVFVFPSVARSEAFGIVQVEAMAAGLPVINTNLQSGVPFVSLHNQTGITVTPADADALAAAINVLLIDEKLRASLGVAARLRAQSEFGLDKMVSRTISLYEGISSGATQNGYSVAELPMRAETL
jgi:rhamnosyl/mannosyltransferase